MPLPNFLGMTPGYGAAADLGFGGDALGSQQQQETDEERRKRLLRAQQMSRLSPASQTLGLGPAGTFR